MSTSEPAFDRLRFNPQEIVADDAEGIQLIEQDTVVVEVTGVTNDANDFVTLPSLARVANGHQIRILCNAGANFELRTPASSNEKINTVDSDGTQEALCTDTDTVVCTKVSATDGWTCTSFTALGGVRTAVIPD